MAETEIRSDIAGRVWQILKAEGEAVAAGEPILVVEAMKMEIPVASDVAGRVLRLLVSEGEEIAEDQVVAVLEPGS
ncbi:acetyl-CoA carboxylase biotin carboxyl carrier protein subunit [Primorskyibacter flagellatus]|uniref:Acetyl-CoA carboxylase biotin carboxyl carrier protein subunit n=1 Tax=Primorskyibacter flagellatus TaxID=1387277 RepID=A0A917EHB1_9RHOB|nr:acetyl-CoA carboxylase biotin carboxyl carrier protein subunit [Primorskyibacter flagellatus]GGE41808.1 acetyl-CoA carboxylase biotin carboxyl carrier protein subunit [Primorskyibacter flagellatus]